MSVTSNITKGITSNVASGIVSGVNDLAAFLNPLVWFDFTDVNKMTTAAVGYGSGLGLETLENKGVGGSEFDLYRNSGVSLTVEDAHVLANGSQNDYRSGNIDSYNFLHDGSGCHVMVIYEQTEATNFQSLINNNLAGSNSNAGTIFYSTQQSNADQIAARFYNKTTNFNYFSDNNVLAFDDYSIAEFTLKLGSDDDLVVRNEGIDLRTGTGLEGNLSADDPADITRFLVSITGKAKAVLIFNQRLTDSERFAVYRKAASFYGLPQMTVNMLIGDSNARGQGDNTALSAAYQNIIKGSYLWTWEDGDTAGTKAFWPHENENSLVDVGRLRDGLQTDFGSPTVAGADLALMKNLIDDSAGRQYLIKTVDDGTDLFAWWDPDTTELNEAWDDFVGQVNEVKAWASKMGRSINWNALISILGHNDSGAEFRANAAGTKMLAIIDAVRTMTSGALPVVQILPNLEGMDYPDAGFTAAAYSKTMRDNMISSAATDDKLFLYQALNTGSDDAAWNETTPDGLHYDMATLEDMGEEIAAGLVATSVPAVSVNPSISGTALIDEVLTLDPGTWTNGVLQFALQWQSDGVDISGANGWQYTVTPSVAGTDITCEVIPSNKAGDGVMVETAAVAVPTIPTSDLNIHLDGSNASAFTLDGSNVQEWDDEVSAGSFNPVVEGYQTRGGVTQNGLDTVTFSGADNNGNPRMTATGSLSSGGTIFFVGNNDGGSGHQSCWLDQEGSNAMYLIFGGNNNTACQVGTGFRTNVTQSIDDTFVQATVDFDSGTDIEMRINGAVPSQTKTTTGSASANFNRLGIYNGGGLNAIGEAGELVVYDAQQSAAVINHVEKYLMDKWGI